jgi:hypothetical protein
MQRALLGPFRRPFLEAANFYGRLAAATKLHRFSAAASLGLCERSFRRMCILTAGFDQTRGTVMAFLKRSISQHGAELVDESRLMRTRMLGAMRALEVALAKPASCREADWARPVVGALSALEDAMRRQIAELEGEDNTLAALARDQPRLLPRIQQLRQQYGDLVRQVSALQAQLTAEGSPQSEETRQRLAWILTALKHFQAKETDLLYEALHVDIGTAD